MASEVNICNLALAHLGDLANVVSISPPEGSAQADHCAQFYPVARDAMLEMHAWGFATKRIALATLGLGDDQPASWLYAYALPSDCIRPLAILLPSSLDDTDTQDFEQEVKIDGTKLIYSNTADATLRYISKITDSTKFTPLFVMALSYLLASYLSGPVTKDVKIKEFMFKLALASIPSATGSDANARSIKPWNTFNPSAIKARE